MQLSEALGSYLLGIFIRVQSSRWPVNTYVRGFSRRGMDFCGLSPTHLEICACFSLLLLELVPMLTTTLSTLAMMLHLYEALRPVR